MPRNSMRSLAPPLRGDGWGGGLPPRIPNTRRVPLTRIAPDDAEPVIGRAFARPVGIARSDPTSPRKRGEVSRPLAAIASEAKQSSLPTRCCGLLRFARNDAYNVPGMNQHTADAIVRPA